MLRHHFTILLSLWSALGMAQMHQPVFSNLQGGALIQALQDTYRPNNLLSYGDARDTLYRNIDARNDTLYCVYTGYSVYLPPGADPTTAAFENGTGINTEHTYPRAKGAEAPTPEADMHHLFPTRALVNAARNNFPFTDIPPNQVNAWYYLDQEQSNTPGSNIELYSRVGDQVFEPRDDHKGDVARAMFYFYTVYQQEANAADPAFFAQQRATLCQWHSADPVSEKEWERTHGIAPYQEGKPNPFVLDCTVADRCYCEGIIPPCTPPVSTETAASVRVSARIFPQPARGQAYLEISLPEAAVISVKLYRAQGQEVLHLPGNFYTAGKHQIKIALPQEAGVYFCRLQWEKGAQKGGKTLKVATF
ncbi:MAG: endonuclease [Phaeodactylibacter sp.]|uniref:endonuclease n=1 Tax=Phaeodactylibacter sp. TaxID=1940289 RepID=UPI0032EE6982